MIRYFLSFAHSNLSLVEARVIPHPYPLAPPPTINTSYIILALLYIIWDNLNAKSLMKIDILPKNQNRKILK
jgi:hypothetical protein